MDSMTPYWLLLAVVPVIVLVSLALNVGRARRWAEKAKAHQAVHCRSCGFVGAPEVGTLAASDPRSSNLRLMCSKCNSPDWFVPDSEQSD